MSSQDRANEVQTDSASVPAAAGTARTATPFTLAALTAAGPDAVLALQRRAGNRTVIRALERSRLQRKKSDPLGHKTISASVGQSSYNLAEDVATVAFLLNKVPSAQGGPTSPLKSDGSVSKEDIAVLTADPPVPTGSEGPLTGRPCRPRRSDPRAPEQLRRRLLPDQPGRYPVRSRS